MVVSEAGFPKSMDVVVSFGHSFGMCVLVRGGDIRLCMCGDRRGEVIFFVVFRIEDDCPARGEHVLVRLEVVGLEANATKDGRDGQCLAIGEVDYRRSHFRTRFALLRCMLCYACLDPSTSEARAAMCCRAILLSSRATGAHFSWL